MIGQPSDWTLYRDNIAQTNQSKWQGYRLIFVLSKSIDLDSNQGRSDLFGFVCITNTTWLDLAINAGQRFTIRIYKNDNNSTTNGNSVNDYDKPEKSKIDQICFQSGIARQQSLLKQYIFIFSIVID